MSFRLDYNSQTQVLHVKLPLFPHDTLSIIVGSLSRNRNDPNSLPADEGGTTNISLADGSSKSADFIWLDPTLVNRDPGRVSDLHAASSNSCPTVVLEVALSESVMKLSIDCARWILCTLGKVNVAMGMKIDAGPDNRKLRAISIREWTLQRVIPNDMDSRPFHQQLRKI